MCSVCRFCYLISIIFRSGLIAILNARLAFNMTLRLCQIQYGTTGQILSLTCWYPGILVGDIEEGLPSKT